MKLNVKHPDVIEETLREEQLPEFVEDRILPFLDDYRIWAFYGIPGAGKTTLIKEICSRRGIDKNRVNSPTFALINNYETESGELIHHFDFYRVESEEEAFDLGYEEYFYGGNTCLIEWPEHIRSILPDGTVEVEIKQPSPDERTYKIVFP